MKIQCDVCDKDEASVFCIADEAALCDSCDHRVHHANKLASKHQCFSLLNPSSSNHFPLCDICQERRAFLFCRHDRAILCKDCDLSIHMVNEHTQKHDRFLLTGVKLSATSSVYISSSSSSNIVLNDAVPNSHHSIKRSTDISSHGGITNPSSSTTINKGGEDCIGNEAGRSIGTSTISEYLIETLPGWHFEDVLDLSSNPFGFHKNVEDGTSPFVDREVQSSPGSFSSESLGIWVPQAPTPLLYPLEMSGHVALKETKEATNYMKTKRDGGAANDGFMVPQVNEPYTGFNFKRSRPFC